MCGDNGSDSSFLAWKVPAMLLEVLSLAQSTAVQKLLEFAAREPFPGLEAKQVLLVWCIAKVYYPTQGITVQSPWCPARRVFLII